MKKDKQDIEKEQEIVEGEGATETVDLQEQLTQALALADDYKDKWYRVSAEFDNYKKRMSVAQSQSYKNGLAEATLKILPIGDNLERALTMVLDETNKAGIELILRAFKEVLASLDVTEINPIGQPFDPNVADAVMQMDGEEGEQSGNVKMVFEKGYKLGDKVIRYAKVSVIK